MKCMQMCLHSKASIMFNKLHWNHQIIQQIIKCRLKSIQVVMWRPKIASERCQREDVGPRHYILLRFVSYILRPVFPLFWWRVPTHQSPDADKEREERSTIDFQRRLYCPEKKPTGRFFLVHHIRNTLNRAKQKSPKWKISYAAVTF